MKECLIQDCKNKAVAKGLCMRHYKQLSRNGFIIDDREEKICKCAGCNEPATRRGMCRKHYDHWRYEAKKRGEFHKSK